jgi:hypothetical protein
MQAGSRVSYNVSTKATYSISLSFCVYHAQAEYNHSNKGKHGKVELPIQVHSTNVIPAIKHMLFVAWKENAEITTASDLYIHVPNSNIYRETVIQ